MRNVDDNRAAEGPPDDGTGATYESVSNRKARRRKQAVIGAVGLLSLLGVGGVVATQVLDDPGTAPRSQTGALQPTDPATPAVPSGAAATASGKPSGSPKRTASPSAPPAGPTPFPSTTAEQIAAARSAAAKATDQVRRPLPPQDARVAAVGDVDLTTSTQRRNGETLTVKSARQDLTGYAELTIAADNGTKVGNARCTNRIRTSAGAPAKERPTFLMCWRTSKEKSVYTFAVKLKGRPSPQTSVAALDEEWTRLG